MRTKEAPRHGVVGKLAREIEALRRKAALSLDELLATVREERARRHAEQIDLVDHER